MGRPKKLRKARMLAKAERRWGVATQYLKSVPVDEVRRFYARSTKYFLDVNNWDSTLGPPTDSHPNLVGMVTEFNCRQNKARMMQGAHPDVIAERSVVTPLMRGKTGRRRQSKQLRRLTYEFMLYIRRNFTVNGTRKGERNRVGRMPLFARMFRQRFLP